MQMKKKNIKISDDESSTMTSENICTKSSTSLTEAIKSKVKPY